MPNRFCANQGFTLVELLIVVTVLMITFAIGLPNLIASRYTSELKSGKIEILSVIELARYKALTNEVLSACASPVGYTVSVDTASLILSSNCEGTLTEIKAFSLTKFPNLEFSASPVIPLNFTFHKLTGIVGSEVILCLKHKILNKSTKINISYSGKITHEDNVSTCP